MGEEEREREREGEKEITNARCIIYYILVANLVTQKFKGVSMTKWNFICSGIMIQWYGRKNNFVSRRLLVETPL